MFRDPETFLGKIDDLAVFDDLGRLVCQRVMTMWALLHLVEDHLIDLRQGLQVTALVARLAPWLLSAWFAQALLLALAKPIGRGR